MPKVLGPIGAGKKTSVVRKRHVKAKRMQIRKNNARQKKIIRSWFK